jgi:uncharacterized protein HemY
VIFALAMADLRDFQGRGADAEAIYESILERAPDHTVALNNLAWLIGRRDPTNPRALKLIEQAIAATGPQSSLLDTRGMLHLRAGNARKAVHDLEAAVTEDPQSVRWFHLALACQAARDLRSAERAWHEARRAGLREEHVAEVDRNSYQALAKAFPPQ